jgi:glyoxylase-like metal-dependent hydrolase (beta-lactamase superfamily II)
VRGPASCGGSGDALLYASVHTWTTLAAPPQVPAAAPGIQRIALPLPFRPREVNAYLVRLEGGGWMLVDGGPLHPGSWRVLEDAVRRLAGGWGEVALHLVTHMHLDHFGAAGRVREASGAPLAMGRLDAERAAHAAADPAEEAEYRAALLESCGVPAERAAGMAGGREASPWVSYAAADHPLEGDAPLPGAAEWRALWTPGHTAGHLSLLRDDGALIGGDAVLERTTPTIGVNRQRDDPVADYLGSLRRLAAACGGGLLPGHGPPIAEPPPRIAELEAITRAESARVAALLEVAPRTPWEVAHRRHAGRDLPPGAWWLALRETLAHLRHLAAEGRVLLEQEGAGGLRARLP